MAPAAAGALVARIFSAPPIANAQRS